MGRPQHKARRSEAVEGVEQTEIQQWLKRERRRVSRPAGWEYMAWVGRKWQKPAGTLFSLLVGRCEGARRRAFTKTVGGRRGGQWEPQFAGRSHWEQSRALLIFGRDGSEAAGRLGWEGLMTCPSRRAWPSPAALEVRRRYKCGALMRCGRGTRTSYSAVFP